MLPQPDNLYSMKYRLPDGLRRLIHGKDVAIIDDVINAGSAMRGTYEALQSCGANPVAIGALLVLGFSASSFCSNQKIPLEYIACLPNDIWLPSECPLCASRIPLEDIK
jgi:orotate phosphoribosyltransferase